MKGAAQNVLVVGGDGFIGRALVRRHRERGDNVTHTTRRHVDSPGAVLLDLQTVPDDWVPPRRIELAYLCAAVARVDECEANPSATHSVNVEGTLRVARALQLAGAFVVLLSTNYVFCDTNPRPAIGDPYCPATEYGRQKAAVEQGLSALPGRWAIVRLTKVLGRESALIERWRGALENGERVVAFSDVHISPISLSFAVDALYRIGSEKRVGVHHLSGRGDISYVALARIVARKLGSPVDLVAGQSYRETKAQFPSPRHGSLDMAAAKSSLGIDPQDAEDVVAELVAS